jgi:DNA-directed RNA polymerase specialized sigma24 family protein
MITPSGMTESETFLIMQRVVEKIAPRYVTHGYSVCDMQQEAYIMCMEALPRYDNARPLENFLSVHVSNRMKNFLRDNVKIKDEKKHKIIKPAQLSHDTEALYEENFEEKIDIKDMINIVDENIPASMRMDYLKMVHNFYVPKQRREEIGEFVRDLLKENGYEEG